MPELPLASLSLPGVVLDPTLKGELVSEPGVRDFLRLQYRFDLPYTDEINALAELPRDDSEPPIEPPAPPPLLTRPEFAAWWQALREGAAGHRRCRGCARDGRKRYRSRRSDRTV
jgi:hypothetical protein